MEARRRELLNEEGGYWSRRMAAEAAAAAQLAATQLALAEVRAHNCRIRSLAHHSGSTSRSCRDRFTDTALWHAWCR